MAGRVWTAPGGQASEGEARSRVPLRGRAVEVLDAAHTPGDGNRSVFPMRSGEPIDRPDRAGLRSHLDFSPPVPDGTLDRSERIHVVRLPV